MNWGIKLNSKRHSNYLSIFELNHVTLVSSYVRTRQIATNNYRNPEIINNVQLYNKVIAENLRELRGNNKRNKGYRQSPRPKRKISASEEFLQV